jgi:hypothetical protein
VVEVTAGGVTQTRRIRAGGTSYLSQGPAEAWFGLGEADAVDLTVRWPDGGDCALSGVRTRQWVEVGPDCP